MKIKIIRVGTGITYGDLEVICDEYEIQNNFIIMKDAHIKYFDAYNPESLVGEEECVEYHLPLSNIVTIRVYKD